MTGWPLLSLTTFLPLVGAAFIFLIRGEPALVVRNARNVALWASLVTFVLSLFIWADIDPAVAGFQLVEQAPWLPSFNITYHMGIDGISMWFVLLVTFLTPLCVLASWTTVKHRAKEYMIAFLVLETLCIGMFCALDFVLFYIFWEAALIPMYLIIGIWGGPRRVYSAVKFFLFTLAGSVLMLLALLALYHQTGTTDIPTLIATPLAPGFETWLWLAFLASFAVKVPMWPVHTWLPAAHVAAPTAGSVILAGVLLKMGGYGFLRFSIPMLPHATAALAPVIFGLSVVAIVYAALVALVQRDMKALVAYASVAEMGFVTLGLFTVTVDGVTGGIVQMLSHGVVAAALFLLIGVAEDRRGSRDIAAYGGLVQVMPVYAGVFLIMVLAAIGLPGTSGFVGKLMSLVGAVAVSPVSAVGAAVGVVLGAAYLLRLYRRVVFGKLGAAPRRGLRDLGTRELVLFAPLLVVVVWLGLFPSAVTDTTAAAVAKLVGDYERALAGMP